MVEDIMKTFDDKDVEALKDDEAPSTPPSWARPRRTPRSSSW